MSTVSGKALLVIECEGDSGYFRLSAWPFIQTARSSLPRDRAVDWAWDTLREFAGSNLNGDARFKHMKEGDKIRVAVRYWIRSWRDYWGEYDESIEITVVRTLRKQPWGSNRKARRRK